MALPSVAAGPPMAVSASPQSRKPRHISAAAPSTARALEEPTKVQTTAKALVASSGDKGREGRTDGDEWHLGLRVALHRVPEQIRLVVACSTRLFSWSERQQDACSCWMCYQWASRASSPTPGTRRVQRCVAGAAARRCLRSCPGASAAAHRRPCTCSLPDAKSTQRRRSSAASSRTISGQLSRKTKRTNAQQTGQPLAQDLWPTQQR